MAAPRPIRRDIAIRSSTNRQQAGRGSRWLAPIAHLGWIALATLVPTSLEAQSAEPKPALAVAEALVAAFNRHDPEAMSALVTPDFELFYFDDLGVAGLALRGPSELAAEMTGYFASRPTVRAVVAEAVSGPIYVSFREQIVGGQSSLAVYEVRDGLVRRVWYYPAEEGVPESPGKATSN